MTSAVAECRDPSSNPMQGTISFSLLLFAINKYYSLINPRNIISNIIMIFNINSTRGQMRFLTCVARGTCLVKVNWLRLFDVLKMQFILALKDVEVVSKCEKRCKLYKLM